MSSSSGHRLAWCSSHPCTQDQCCTGWARRHHKPRPPLLDSCRRCLHQWTTVRHCSPGIQSAWDPGPHAAVKYTNAYIKVLINGHNIVLQHLVGIWNWQKLWSRYHDGRSAFHEFDASMCRKPWHQVQQHRFYSTSIPLLCHHACHMTAFCDR